MLRPYLAPFAISLRPNSLVRNNSVPRLFVPASALVWSKKAWAAFLMRRKRWGCVNLSWSASSQSQRSASVLNIAICCTVDPIVDLCTRSTHTPAIVIARLNVKAPSLLLKLLSWLSAELRSFDVRFCIWVVRAVARGTIQQTERCSRWLHKP